MAHYAFASTIGTLTLYPQKIRTHSREWMTMDSSEDACLFLTLEPNRGYWQIHVRAEDRDETTVTSNAGTYHFKRMPLELINTPATFQRTLDMVLSQYNWQTCLIYLDDIFNNSTQLDKNIQDVANILHDLQQAGISIYLKKCEWWKTSINYMGHITSPGHVRICGTKVQALEELNHPQTQSDLRAF